MEENHYRTLGVPRTALKADIEAAYRKFSQTIDPKYFAVIKVWTYAYCVLKDDARRIEHDLELDKYETSNKSAPPNASTSSTIVDNSEIEVDDITNKSDNEKTKKTKKTKKLAVPAPAPSTPPPSNVFIEEDVQRMERKVCRNFFLISMAIVPLILIIIGWFDAKVYSFDETSTYPIKRSTSAGSANLIGTNPNPNPNPNPNHIL